MTIVAIKERPILMSGAMVRALLNGSMTQTRRIIKQQPPSEHFRISTLLSTTGNRRNEGRHFWGRYASIGNQLLERTDEYFSCPHGQPGERHGICYGNTTDRHSINHNKQHDNESDTNEGGRNANADSSVSERRLHGGSGRADLFADRVQGLRKEGADGLVPTGGSQVAQGLHENQHVARGQESDQGRAPVGVHGLPRDASPGNVGGSAPERQSGGQLAGESGVGRPIRELAGPTLPRDGALRGGPPEREVNQCRTGASALGNREGAMLTQARGTNAGHDAISNQRANRGGDRLYVREAYRTLKAYDHLKPSELPADAPFYYEADGLTRNGHWGRYRHARFMPRVASRLLLEIMSVRVERLQEISEADAKAEGATCCIENMHAQKTYDDVFPSARQHYHKIWDSINGPDSWALNPWVFALTFKIVNP
jgi:hypothetical protein